MSSEERLQRMVDRAKSLGTSDEVLRILLPDMKQRAVSDAIHDKPIDEPALTNWVNEDAVRNELLNPPREDAPTPRSENEVRKTMGLPAVEPELIVTADTPEEKVMRDDFPSSWVERKKELIEEHQKEQGGLG